MHLNTLFIRARACLPGLRAVRHAAYRARRAIVRDTAGPIPAAAGMVAAGALVAVRPRRWARRATEVGHGALPHTPKTVNIYVMQSLLTMR